MSRMAALEREIRGQTICLAIIVGFLVLGSLAFLKAVLLPFVLAIFIVTGLNPLLAGIQSRFSTTRWVALAIAAVIGFVLTFVLWSILWLSVVQLRDNADRYAAQLKEIVELVDDWTQWFGEIPGQLVGILEPENSPDQDPSPAVEPTTVVSPQNDPADGDLADNGAALEIAAPPEDSADAAAVTTTDETPDAERKARSISRESLTQMFNDNIPEFLDYLRKGLMDILNSGTMVVIFVFFLLLGSSEAAPRSGLWQEIDRSIREYIVSKTLISFFTGLAFGFVLWLFGIPLAVVFALLAFLFNFIPNIGPIIASVLPLPLILLDPELSIWGMIGVIVLSSAVQVISGNVIEPRMMGDSFDLHPIAILLALLFWGMIWGVIGMFLATPITAVMKIVFSKFKMTRPLADLLAGRLDGVKERYAEYMGKEPSSDAEPVKEPTTGSASAKPKPDAGGNSA